MINYGFTKELNMQFEETLEKVFEELKKAELGVWSIIDLKEKFKERLGINFKKYVILGTSHPPNAHQCVLAEENIGLMLPYNVILYEKDKKTVLSVIKPTAVIEMIDNENLEKIAAEMEKILKHVFDSVRDGK
jgi:uncharacterized protein (DUF302 family)